MHDSYIAQDHLLLALIKDSTVLSALKEASLTENTLKTAIQQTRGDRRVDSKQAEQGFDALQKYAVDLTGLAEEGKIDPVIGRDNEIRRVIRILCRRYVLPITILLIRTYTDDPFSGQRIIRFSLVNLVSVKQQLQRASLSVS